MKLAAALLVSFAFAAPAVACPNMDHDSPKAAEAPKTADKSKPAPPADTKKDDAATKTKDDAAKTKDDAKDKDTKTKAGDKVSQK